MTGIVHRSDLHENVNAWTFSPVDNYANRDYGDKALRSINHDSQNADTSALSRYKRIGNKDENFPTSWARNGMSEYSIVEFQKISSFETCTYFVQNYIFHSRMKLFEEINLTNKTRTNKNYIL